MKNLITAILFMLFCSFSTIAQTQKSAIQEGQVSKSLYGIQVGPLGIWGHNEFRIGAAASLKIEAGLHFATLNGGFGENRELFAFPVFTAEPRYYYNLDNRLSKGKKIDKNSGNFISLLVKARTGRTIQVRSENRRYKEDYGVYARWGLKRTYGKHFTMETAVGPGIVRSNSYNRVKLRSDLDVMFRIGYTF